MSAGLRVGPRQRAGPRTGHGEGEHSSEHDGEGDGRVASQGLAGAPTITKSGHSRSGGT